MRRRGGLRHLTPGRALPGRLRTSFGSAADGVGGTDVRPSPNSERKLRPNLPDPLQQWVKEGSWNIVDCQCVCVRHSLDECCVRT